MSALVWEEPPPPRSGVANNRHNEIKPNPLYLRMVEELRSQRGRWARIGQFDTRSRASGEMARIKSGREPAFHPLNEYEFAVRTFRIYARWLGAVS